MADGEAKVEGAPGKPARLERNVSLGLILQVVNTVVLVAVLALQVLRPGGLRPAARGPEEKRAASAPAEKAGTDGAKAAEAGPGPTMRLADFVVHLRDPDTDRYARVSFELELKDEKSKEGLTARLPQVRDAFLVYLSDRSSEELRGGEAIARVKNALAMKLGEVARDVPVRALYITELVVQ
jgi:flagellar FliL protein